VPRHWAKNQFEYYYAALGTLLSKSRNLSFSSRSLTLSSNFGLYQSFSDPAISSDSDSDWCPKFGLGLGLGLGLKKSWLSFTLNQNNESMKYLWRFNYSFNYSMLLNAIGRYLTLLNDARRWGDLAGRLGGQTWPADLAGRLGRQTWPADLAGRLGRQTWPADLAGQTC
jgi:hypothetical protein